jgi:hypothetical protein
MARGSKFRDRPNGETQKKTAAAPRNGDATLTSCQALADPWARSASLFSEGALPFYSADGAVALRAAAGGALPHHSLSHSTARAVSGRLRDSLAISSRCTAFDDGR